MVLGVKVRGSIVEDEDQSVKTGSCFRWVSSCMSSWRVSLRPCIASYPIHYLRLSSISSSRAPS